LNNKNAASDKGDWFEQGLLQRVPSNIRSSFSEEQLSALKVAFGARKWGKHPVDLRGTASIWHWRYYFVFLMGRNKRSLSDREKRLSLMLKATLMTAFIVISTLLGLLVIYLIKSAADIDIFPGFSLGIWGWFKAELNGSAFLPFQ